jgi:precorrin-6B methylase 1
VREFAVLASSDVGTGSASEPCDSGNDPGLVDWQMLQWYELRKRRMACIQCSSLSTALARTVWRFDGYFVEMLCSQLVPLAT